MAEAGNPATDKPPPRPKKKHTLLKVLVVLLGLGFLGWELYRFSPGVRVGVVKVLGWFGPSAMPRVLGYCDDESAEVKVAAIDVLVGAGAEAVPALEQALSDPDAPRRRFAAQLLTRIGPTATAARPALAETASKDRDLQVRKAAVEALGAVGGKDAAAVQALIDLLGDGDPLIRQTAVKALGRVEPRPKAAVPALAGRLKDESAAVRMEAAEALEQFGPAAHDAIPALEQALQDPAPGVVREAKEALESIRRAPPSQK